MKLYTTTIKAINPQTGKLCIFQGPNVLGVSFKTAQEYCNKNGLGYCKVDGELISEIDGSHKIDYNFLNN